MGCCSSNQADVRKEGHASEASTRKARRHSIKSSHDKSCSSGTNFGTLTQLYSPIRLLGSGGCGDTYLMDEISTGRRVAIKIIPRPIPKAMVNRIETEIIVQAVLGAQCSAVVEAYDAILTDKHLALSMELAQGGSMIDYVTSKFKTNRHGGLFISEPEACYFFRQFIEAVDFCHRNHIAHRDLKLDNTLLTGDSPMHLKLADFGFAKTWTSDSNMSTILGTPEYMSPEQAKAGNHSSDNYDASHSDIWSSGVVLFVMMLGFFPFEVKATADTPVHDFQQQLRQVWAQQQDEQWFKTRHVAMGWALLSEQCQDLLMRIFEYDEDKRISLEDIKGHPWYNQKLPLHYAKELQKLKKIREAKMDKFGSSCQDPIQMRQRATRLRAIVQAAAYPAGADESTRILESQPSVEDETQTWVKDAATHPLVTRVSLRARSWMAGAGSSTTFPSSTANDRIQASSSAPMDVPGPHQEPTAATAEPDEVKIELGSS